MVDVSPAVDLAPLPPALEAPPAPALPTSFRLDPAHTGRSGFALPRTLRERARFPARGRISSQAVAFGDGGLAFTAHDGVLYTTDGTSADAGVRGRLATGDRVYGTALTGPDGTLYFGSDADRFVAWSPSGGLRAALATDGDADTSAVLCPDGSLRFAAGHVLYAVEPDLTVRWRLEVPGKIFSSPALTADGLTVFGAQDDRVYAVDAAGQVRWSVVTGGDVDAPPAVAPDGMIFVGSDDGMVYALGPDGALRWRHAVGGHVRAAVGLGLDGTVLAPTYGPRARLVALDRGDGHERWSFAVAGPPTEEYGLASAPLVDREGAVAFGAPDDTVYILERDGALRARFPLGADVDAPPVLVADGVLVVGADDGALHVLGD